MTNPLLHLSEVTKVHGQGVRSVTALDGVDLQINPGELVAVMGPSGSGKSSLLNIAGGLDRPTSGSVVIAGTDFSRASAQDLATIRRCHVGVVYQELNLIPALTAVENVALPLELAGSSVRDARKEALASLAQVGLEGLESRFPDDLSGGQQQRVAIARSLMGSRRILLADEPTGALDSAAGEEIMSLLRDRADRGAAVVVVTHNARHAAWADRLLSLRDGRFEQPLHSPAAAAVTERRGSGSQPLKAAPLAHLGMPAEEGDL